MRADLWLKVIAKSHAKLRWPAVGWAQELCKDVGKTVLGRRLAWLGPVGQCAPAYSVHLLERSREVRAAWRALFLLCKEGVGGGFERGVAKTPESLRKRSRRVR